MGPLHSVAVGWPLYLVYTVLVLGGLYWFGFLIWGALREIGRYITEEDRPANLASNVKDS